MARVVTIILSFSIVGFLIAINADVIPALFGSLPLVAAVLLVVAALSVSAAMFGACRYSRWQRERGDDDDGNDVSVVEPTRDVVVRRSSTSIQR